MRKRGICSLFDGKVRQILISNDMDAGVGLLRAFNPDLVLPICIQAQVERVACPRRWEHFRRQVTAIDSDLWCCLFGLRSGLWLNQPYLAIGKQADGDHKQNQGYDV